MRGRGELSGYRLYANEARSRRFRRIVLIKHISSDFRWNAAANGVASIVGKLDDDPLSPCAFHDVRSFVEEMGKSSGSLDPSLCRLGCRKIGTIIHEYFLREESSTDDEFIPYAVFAFLVITYSTLLKATFH